MIIVQTDSLVIPKFRKDLIFQGENPFGFWVITLFSKNNWFFIFLRKHQLTIGHCRCIRDSANVLLTNDIADIKDKELLKKHEAVKNGKMVQKNDYKFS